MQHYDIIFSARHFFAISLLMLLDSHAAIRERCRRCFRLLILRARYAMFTPLLMLLPPLDAAIRCHTLSPR